MAKGDKQDVASAKRVVNKRAAKELTKINKGGVKISRTNSNFKSSVPVKPGTPKANATATNKSKVALTKKWDAREAKQKLMQKSDFKSLSTSASKTGVKNKVKAQGTKSMSAPTSGYNRTKPKGK